MVKPIDISKEYEKRAREKIDLWAINYKPLPVEEETWFQKQLDKAPYLILKYIPEFLPKFEKFLRSHDISFPLMGTLFKLFNWGFSYLRKRASVK